MWKKFSRMNIPVPPFWLSRTSLFNRKKTSLEQCLLLGLEKSQTLNVVKASCGARKQERTRKYKEEARKGQGNKVKEFFMIQIGTILAITSIKEYFTHTPKQ